MVILTNSEFKPAFSIIQKYPFQPIQAISFHTKNITTRKTLNYAQSDFREICGGCGRVLANTDTYDLVWDLLKAYEEEHCQACENYPYPQPEEPYAEPVSEPPWCSEGICE